MYNSLTYLIAFINVIASNLLKYTCKYSSKTYWTIFSGVLGFRVGSVVFQVGSGVFRAGVPGRVSNVPGRAPGGVPSFTHA